MAIGNWRAGVDIGGTFTDLLLVDEQSGRFRVGKVLTTTGEPAAGVRAALTSELQSGDLSADALGTLVDTISGRMVTPVEQNRGRSRAGHEPAKKAAATPASRSNRKTASKSPARKTPKKGQSDISS